LGRSRRLRRYTGSDASAAERPAPNQVFYAATVQEEGSIEMRGAQTPARVINPHIRFSLEVGIPNDVPGPGPKAAQEVPGGGPGMMRYAFSELPTAS
jgi:putative aminopeptidase FrvX